MAQYDFPDREPLVKVAGRLMSTIAEPRAYTPDDLLRMPDGDRYELVEEKVQEYLGAGVRLVWVIYPTTRTVYIHRGDRSSAVVRSGNELTGEDVLPGFVCPLDELFAAIPQTTQDSEKQ